MNLRESLALVLRDKDVQETLILAGALWALAVLKIWSHA